jgi:hypothetical protein
MPLERGAVYMMRVGVTQAISSQMVSADKYVVVLQDPTRMHASTANFAYVMVSRDRYPGRRCQS